LSFFVDQRTKYGFNAYSSELQAARFRGRRHSEETRSRIGEANKKAYWAKTPEERAKSFANRVYKNCEPGCTCAKHDPEVCAKRREAPEFWRDERRTGISEEESRKTMRARPEVRDILIAHKMRYWSLRAQYPTAFPNCSATRARRNLLRLLARHPHIGRLLNMDIRSAYPPL
jgi:hypothetical protein